MNHRADTLTTRERWALAWRVTRSATSPRPAAIREGARAELMLRLSGLEEARAAMDAAWNAQLARIVAEARQ